MTTLTRISIVARKTVRFGIYFLIIITIIRISFGTLTSVYKRMFPERIPDPTQGFGLLPDLPFIELNHEDITYRLETPDLDLPSFPDRMRVYTTFSPQTDIQALPNARETARRLGFNPQGVELVESVYVFNHVREPSKLTFNIITRVFSVNYDIRSNLLVVSGIPPSPDSATKLAQDFLNRGGMMREDIIGPITHEFLTYQNEVFRKAPSQSDSNAIKINFYRKDYEDRYPSMPPNPRQANIWFTFSTPASGPNQMIRGEYKYFAINEGQRETYPIITPEEAWTKLMRGDGHVVSLDEGVRGEIAIRSIYLAYYDAGQFVPFYQPIVVFEGDHNLVVYLHATTDVSRESTRAELDEN